MSENTMSLQQQVIYELGQIKAKVESGFEALEKRMDGFTSGSKELEARVKELENWKTTANARFSIIGSIVIAVWTFAAPLVQSLAGIK